MFSLTKANKYLIKKKNVNTNMVFWQLLWLYTPAISISFLYGLLNVIIHYSPHLLKLNVDISFKPFITFTLSKAKNKDEKNKTENEKWKTKMSKLHNKCGSLSHNRKKGPVNGEKQKTPVLIYLFVNVRTQKPFPPPAPNPK